MGRWSHKWKSVKYVEAIKIMPNAIVSLTANPIKVTTTITSLYIIQLCLKSASVRIRGSALNSLVDFN